MNISMILAGAAAALLGGVQTAPEVKVPAAGGEVACAASAEGRLQGCKAAGPVLRNPNWVARPSGADVREVYPKEALRQRLEGRATIACEAAADGSLTNCVVAAETPQGAGFGAAALALAPKFRMAAQAADGAPVQGARVRIPVSFRAG